jgi:hypothetical protein
MKGRNNLTTAEFKTMVTFGTPVSILEEIDGRRCKMSKREFSRRILEAGLLLRDHENIIVTTSVVPSGLSGNQPSPRAAVTVEEVGSATTTTTPPQGTNQEEVRVT